MLFRLLIMLDIHTMNKGHYMLKKNGFDVFYFHPDVLIALAGNSYECR